MHTFSHNAAGLHLTWRAEYHGPNPMTESAAVVADLRAELMPNVEHVSLAGTQLWVLSGVKRPDGEALVQDGVGDALLALGSCAVVWALAALNEVRGFVLHAGAVRSGEAVRLWVGFHHAPLSRAALQLGLRTLTRLINGDVDSSAFKAELEKLWLACRRHHPDYQARILMVGARGMDVPFLHFLQDSKYWQFGWGNKARVFMESSSNQDGLLGSQWQKNKATGKGLMASLGLPTPAYTLVTRSEDVALAVECVGLPCVLKPLDSGGGKGVTANVNTVADAQIAFLLAHREKRGAVMVEAHLKGDDHRLMVINGRFVAAIRREPSFVVGDGQKTVATLVAELNAQRSSNIVRSRYLRPIALDEVLARHLSTQRIVLTDVPIVGQRVSLRSNANLSTGGVCTDVTARCHPQIRSMAVLLAKTSGISTIGIDYLTTDITRAPAETGGAFIEMNTTPGLDACVAAGWSEAAIARLVLGDCVQRIPVHLTVISAAGLDAVRMSTSTPELAEDEALVVGDGLRVGGVSLRIVAIEPWEAVKAGLRNVGVGKLHVICSAGDLIRHGCPLDRVSQVTVAEGEGGAALDENWVGVLESLNEGAVAYQPEQEILHRLGAGLTCGADSDHRSSDTDKLLVNGEYGEAP